MPTKKKATKRRSSSTAKQPAKPLTGQVAVVTGGARGIGRAIAEAFVRAGCRVIITGRDERALALAAEQIGTGVLTRHCDVRRPESVAALMTAVKKQFGRLDILVNNAGVAHGGATIDKVLIEEWQEVIETNLTGTFLVTREALPLMHAGSTVVNNLSISAKTVFPGMAAYNASKHGALGFTDTLREELRPRGIRVIALMPGATDTDIWQQFWPEAPRTKMMSPESVADALLAAILLPGNATVSELVVSPTGGAL